MKKQIVYAFAGAINAHDIDQIYALLADGHQFIDAHGNQVVGRDQMKTGWAGYFKWFPDYKIEITELFDHNDTFAAFGFASGTYQGQNHWRLPAAWKVIISEDKIKLWQVYSDTRIPFESMNKN